MTGRSDGVLEQIIVIRQPFLLLTQIYGQMFDDRVEESFQLAGERKTGKFFKQVREGILEDIGGIVRVVGKTHGQMKNPITIAEIKALESSRIPTISRHNVGLVGIHYAECNRIHLKHKVKLFCYWVRT